MDSVPELTIRLPDPHPKQAQFIDDKIKRKMIRAGRRGGKTVGVGILSVELFLAGHRILYATPTAEQVDQYWTTVTNALAEPIENKLFYINNTLHLISLRGTNQRIRAKTAWNADTLRGDWADVLILDEYQLMDEDAWGVVGVPMLLDNNGDAIFIYTPPSLHSSSVTKAKDPRHASKMYKKAQEHYDKAIAAGKKPRWKTYHFTSFENPHISKEALDEIAGDMTATAFTQEIMAEDTEEAPGALWHMNARTLPSGKVLHGIEDTRVTSMPTLDIIVVGVDPSATSRGDEAGIIVAGFAWVGKERHLYVLEDLSVQGSPEVWGAAAVTAYNKWKANRIVAEVNNGGEMVRLTLQVVDKNVVVEMVSASRGKATRAEPIAAVYEQGRGHHVGTFPKLESELVLWEPETGMDSPNRLDALVWAASKLVLSATPGAGEWTRGTKAKIEELEKDLTNV